MMVREGCSRKGKLFLRGLSQVRQKWKKKKNKKVKQNEQKVIRKKRKGGKKKVDVKVGMHK